MKRSLILFQWDKTTAAERAKLLRAEGWIVAVESEDGARGGKKVFRQQPDVVLLDLSKRPSHSRETASGIRGNKAGRDVPILFVDGADEDIVKTKAKVMNAMFTRSEKLVADLERLTAQSKK